MFRVIVMLVSMWMVLAGGFSSLGAGSVTDVVRHGVANALTVKAAYAAPAASGWVGGNVTKEAMRRVW